MDVRRSQAKPQDKTETQSPMLQDSTTESETTTPPDDSPALTVRVQRTRLLVGTWLVGVVVVVLAIVFHYGVSPRKFNATDTDDKKKVKLLDDYNSYSANVASVFGRPIEIIVGLVVQVMALRFATPMLLQVETKRRVKIGLLLFVALIEFLVLKGFNALNVQLRAEPAQPVMSATDLSFAATLNSSVTNATNVTTASLAFSEVSPRNPISNTVLRNLVLPRAAQPTPRTRKCSDNYVGLRRLDAVDFGFPSHPWQQDTLSVALEPTTLRVPLNNHTDLGDAAKQLPMDVSIATNLFVNIIQYGDESLGWENTANLRNDIFGFKGKEGESEVVSVVERMGLRPPETADKSTQREWFLRQARTFLANSTFAGDNDFMGILTSFEFSHVNLSSNIAFDAITMEISVDAANGSTYVDFESTKPCGPWPGVCLSNVPQYDAVLDDAISSVAAFSVCLNEAMQDEEMIYRVPIKGNSTDMRPECNDISNSSLLVFAIGNRLVAESLSERVDKSMGLKDVPETHSAVTNLRKIYTLTVGRLSWKTTDLATESRAGCAVKEGAKCLGLSHVLENKRQNLFSKRRYASPQATESAVHRKLHIPVP